MSDHAVGQLRVLIHAPVGKDGKMIDYANIRMARALLNKLKLQSEK